MTDISGFNTRVTIRASNTFPSGFTVTEFADDADPVDIPSQQIADKATGLNGHMVTWSKANPIPMTLSVIPDSEDDRNLSALAEANRVGRGKLSARDVITATIIYPDGSTSTLSGGVLTDAPLSTSVASAGRRKSKAYMFAFEGASGTGAA
jgi:hypothetical protein